MTAEGRAAILPMPSWAVSAWNDTRRHKVSVTPARVHLWDGDWRTTRVRTIGFRWRCSCGAFGKIRSTPRVARGEGREHEAGHE